MENGDMHYRRGGEAGPSQEGLGVSGLIASSAEWREGELRATPTRHSREGELRTPPRHLIIPGHQRVDSSASEVSLDEGRDLMHRDEGDLSMGIASSSSSGSSLENQLVTGSTMKKEFKIKVSPMRMHHYGSDSDLGERPLVCEICDTQVGLDLDGNEFVPCECAFPICRKCYEYIREHDGGNCPQCREKYKRMAGSPLMPWDVEEETSEGEDEDGFQQTPLLPRYGTNSLEGPPSVKLLKNESSGVNNSQVVLRVNAADIEDPDELEKNYGMGSIVWTPALQRINSPGDEYAKVQGDEKAKPLSRKVPIKWKLLNPYRAIVFVRFAVMVLFLTWRVNTPNNKAYWLWFTSVVCEIWFAVSWLFDQAQKWSPITRETYLDRLELKYDHMGEASELAGVDVFVSTADPEKEPPLVTANVILSVLAADYPTDKIACYLSDDGGALLTYEALHETSCFARHWVPFCKKFEIEPRAPEMYFGEKGDYLKGQVKQEFVKERRSMKRLYEEFKVRINALVAKAQNRPRDGWTMADGSPWPGNKRSDHESMIQVLLQPDGNFPDVQMNKLPWLVYVSREKRPKHDHNKKAGAMNSLVRASGVITNAPYILNLDCDHYVNYAKAFKEAMCFMMDPVKGPGICYVQFPQRFDGIDSNDRYSNHNTVFYDINMKGLDSIQGPVYVGTGCCFRRQALYGYEPPQKARDALRAEEKSGFLSSCCGLRKRKSSGGKKSKKGQADAAAAGQELADEVEMHDLQPDLKPLKQNYEDLKKRFGKCDDFINSTLETGVSSAVSQDFSEPDRVLRNAIEVTAIDYEKGSLWGKDIGWIYGSITEDIVTGFVMHSRGWRSVYCMTKRPAFKGTAPINMADRLHQVLRWGLGSVEIFFSRHNPIWYGYRRGGRGLKGAQRLAYINTTIYPFTSIPLVVYCMLPAMCLFFNQFVTPEISSTALIYFFIFFASIAATSIMEMRWSHVTFTDYWRNEQFWVIGGTSSHLAAVWQGILKVVFRVDSKFTLTQKDLGDIDDEFAELYIFRWTWLILPPIAIIFVNCLGIAIGVTRELVKVVPSWGDLFGKLAFSGWVLIHLYPFAKGLMGRRNRIPPYVWLVLGAMFIGLGIGYTTFFTVTGVAGGTPDSSAASSATSGAAAGSAYANGLYYGP